MAESQISRPRILIADDQPDVLTALRLLLKQNSYDIVEATSPTESWGVANSQKLDAVLMDLNYTRGSTSGAEGLDLLTQLGQLDESPPVIVMTAWGSVELAVEAMRRGARDFVEKPWSNERLLSILQTQIALVQALREGKRLKQENRLLRSQSEVTLLAESKAMQPVLEVIARVGPSEANVLITGENGSGKSVIAQALHAASHRCQEHMVTVNIGGLSESLFESELFGHVKGAFTDAGSDRAGRFEIASGGTLFLDEVTNIPVNMQARMLRVIETGQYEKVGSSKTLQADVRIISATNADIDTELVEGRFREDLLYRLNTVQLHIPPLRERREDIPLLADHFLDKHNHKYRKDICGFSNEARNLLLQYLWPGNVRELDHAIERAVLMTSSNQIRAKDLGLQSNRIDSDRIEEMDLDEVERLLIQKALERFDGNVSQAANALGLSRSALYRRLSKHGF